jgi:general secretion pathway protein G
LRRLNMSESVEYASVETYAQRNSMAVAALVVGIMALVLSVVVIGGVLGVVAVILGIVGATRPGKKGMAITGIVTGACALPVAFVAVLVWVSFGMFAAMRPRAGAARVHVAQAELSNLKTTLDVYKVDTGRLPTTNEGLEALVVNPGGDVKTSWSGPYVIRVPVDPWGRPYVYRAGKTKSDEPELLSLGPDGVEGTLDDVRLLPP